MINLSIGSRIGWAVFIPLCAVIFTVDVIVPLGFSTGVLYVPAILVAYFSAGRTSNAYFLASVATILTLVGYEVSPAADHTTIAMANRVFAIAMIWSVSSLLAYLSQREQMRKIAVRQRAAWQATRDGVLIVDGTRQILDANPAARAMLQLGKAKLGKIDDFFGSSCTETQVGFPASLEQHLINSSNRLQVQSSTGNSFPAQIALNSFEADGQPLYACMIQDRTHEQQAEVALLQAKNAAEAANRAKATFLASMNHEIRTPLNAVLGFAQLVALDRNRRLDREQQEYVRHIVNSGNHLLSLVTDIFDLAKIEVGRLTVSIENFAIDELLDQCASNISELARKHGITIDVEIEQPDLCIKADFTRTMQCVLNLMTNGIKYNRHGGRVWVSAKAHDDMIQLTVRDDGVGIPAERLETIFEPFNRLGLEGGTIEGSGIGLTIVKSLVGLMGGTLDVESTEGIGSRFYINLPKAVGAVQAAEEIQLQPQPASIVFEQAAMTVLYVEDNGANQEIMKALFKYLENVTLVSATSAEDALTYLDANEVQLILLDINLPGMNGFEACSLLKAAPRTANIPVIAVSADATQRNIAKAKAVGVQDFIAKPFDVLKTQEAILSTLRA